MDQTNGDDDFYGTQMDLCFRTFYPDQPTNISLPFTTTTTTSANDYHDYDINDRIIYTMYDTVDGDVQTIDDSIGICDSQWPIVSVKWLYFMVTLFLTCLCIVGNGLVIFVITVQKSLRTPTFYALRSLSVVSILYLLFLFFNSNACQTSDLLGTFRVHRIKDDTCAWHSNVGICINQIALAHLALIAGIRVFIISYPLKARVHLTVSKVRIISLLMWSISVVLETIFYLLKVRKCEYGSFLRWTPYLRYKLAEFVIMIMSVLVFYTAANIIARVKSKESLAFRTASQKRQSSAASLALIGFVCFHFPMRVANMALTLSCDVRLEQYSGIIWMIATTGEFLIYAINPFILVIGLQHIRNSIKEKLCFCKSKPTSTRRGNSKENTVSKQTVSSALSNSISEKKCKESSRM